jgi:phospholipid/cholesterol/gamma-HCH transport system substrate-binding protein
MKSTRNTRAVTVGIFVLIGIAIFIVAVLALGGQRKTFANTFLVKAIFYDVNGLQNGSNIWFEGVKIGTVHKIEFTKDARVEVQMNVEEKSKEYIHSNAFAKIGTEGLIGNKIVVIYGGGPPAPALKEGDVLGVEKAVSMDEMMNTLQSNNKNLQDITSNFRIITKRLADGEGTIGKLLKDESIANDLQSTLAILKRSAENARQMMNNVNNYTALLQKKGSLANELVTDTVVFNRLRNTTIKLDELSSSANRMVENLNSATSSINKSLNDPNTPAGVLLHDQGTATNIKQMVKSLQSSSVKLDQDLEALQHNFLFKGFFKRKAKETAKQ